MESSRSRHSRVRSGLRTLLVTAILGIVLLGSIPLAGLLTDRAGSGSSGGRPPTISPATVVPATLLGGGPLAHTSPEFWSLVVQTDCPTCIATNPAVGGFLNQTPFDWFRYSQQSDQCNISANVLYRDDGSIMGGCGYSISAYHAWCAARGPTCHSILDLPAENNNSAEDAAIAAYVVGQAHFQPDYWSIGNEPMGWTHYGIPWTHWSTADASVPTPLAYAYDVKAAIAAVSKVDPGARFIGIQAACECNTVWFQDVVQLNGPSLSAIAYHTYPSTALSTSVTLQQFYDPLASQANISTSYATVRSAIRGLCAQCGTLPILVDEFNAGPGWTPSNYAGTYANAVFLAASSAQALSANVTQFSVFDLQTYSSSAYGYSMMDSNNVLGPTGLLYSGLLSHLATGTVYGTSVETSVPSVWSVETSSSTQTSLLVVNANLTQSILLGLGTAFPTGVAGTAYQWAPGEATPSATSGTIAGTYSVPAQGILLLTEAAVAPTTLSTQVSTTVSRGEAPLSVPFGAAVQGGLPPYSFSWSFGDGGSSSLQSPSHVFAAPGVYAPRLTVTDAHGRTASSALWVTVLPRVSAVVSFSADPTVINSLVTVTAHVTGGVAPYHISWTVNGRVMAIYAATFYLPVRTFATTIVTVHVADALHCTASASGSLTVVGGGLLPGARHSLPSDPWWISSTLGLAMTPPVAPSTGSRGS